MTLEAKRTEDARRRLADRDILVSDMTRADIDELLKPYSTDAAVLLVWAKWADKEQPTLAPILRRAASILAPNVKLLDVVESPPPERRCQSSACAINGCMFPQACPER
jgi:hypothetical protein